MAKLIKAENLNYGRLRNSSVRLDEKVIAIVGPNEAGKSTFLEALQLGPSGSDIKQNRIPRSISNENPFTVIKLVYQLSPDDENVLKNNPLALDVCPRRVAVTVKSNSELEVTFEPEPARKAEFFKYLSKFESNGKLDEEQAQKLKRLHSAFDTNTKIDTTEFQSLVDALDNNNRPKETACLKRVLASLDKALWLKTWDQCQGLLPRFMFFDNESRDLRSDYVFDEQLREKTPKALSNILCLASIQFHDLDKAIQGDETLADDIINKGNRIMSERFSSLWSQSSVVPRLKLNGNKLTVQFEEESGTITRFDTRSTGLRTFLSLLAFLHAEEAEGGIILLIDEAENHLHVDAQVSLVDAFLKQDLVDKVIYTTHSPACLPPDMGNGIKAVVPDSANELVSSVTGNLLALDKGGVFPISYAMGAMTSALSAYKAAIIVEGTSDAILLPTLIKHATKKTELAYRVVPGLAQTSPRLYKDYELLAAYAVYLVDGDDAGEEYERLLREAGIESKRIIRLPSATILEDLVAKKCYLKAYNEILAETHCSPECVPESIEIEAGTLFQKLHHWCNAHNMTEPSKNAVAYRVIERAETLELADGAKKILVELNEAAIASFQ